MEDKKTAYALSRIYSMLHNHYGPQGWWPGRTRFEIIVGAILTQNTAWINVEKAIRSLREARALSPYAMSRLSKKRLSKLIRSAGYHNVKAQRVLNFISFLFSEYGGSLNRMSRQETHRLRNELLSVNGIGPETCDSILLYAFNQPVFVVDAYTKRIFSRHNFITEAADYHTVQEFFMSSLSKDARLYNEYHALIVRTAKEYCKTRPSCGTCPLKEALTISTS